MPRFYATNELNTLIKKYLKKDEYKNCKQDLCSFFAGKTIQDILSLPILLSSNNGFNLIKSRVCNSVFNKGKSGGYRLYFFVDKKAEAVYLFGFYPKSGKYGQEDLTDTEFKISIRNYSKSMKQNSLIEYNINDNFNLFENEFIAL